MAPFRAAIAAGAEAVMPAHVVYPAVDSQPASRSRIWLQDIYAANWASPAIISDDLEGRDRIAAPGGQSLRPV